MTKIQIKDTRKDIFSDFDGCMKECVVGFCGEVTNIVKNGVDRVRLCQLVEKEVTDLDVFHDNAMRYDDEIKYSMLDIRRDINLGYKNKIEEEIVEMKRCQTLMHDLPPELQKGTQYAFEKFFTTMTSTDKMLAILVNLYDSRTEDDCAEIYEKTLERYESTDEFCEFKKNYIDRTYRHRLRGKLVSPKQIEDIINERNTRAMDDMEISEIWTAASDNPTLATKLFIERRLSEGSAVRKFLQYYVEIKFLEEWENDVIKYTFKIGKGSVVDDKLEFITPYSKERLSKAWKGIHKVMDDAKAKGWEWCALYHALSVKNWINNVSFWTFKKFIQQEFGVEIITKENYQKYKKNYFVVTNKEKWDLENYRTYYLSREDNNKRGSSFGEKQLNIYNRITDTILEPLLKVIAK